MSFDSRWRRPSSLREPRTSTCVVHENIDHHVRSVLLFVILSYRPGFGARQRIRYATTFGDRAIRWYVSYETGILYDAYLIYFTLDDTRRTRTFFDRLVHSHTRTWCSPDPISTSLPSRVAPRLRKSSLRRRFAEGEAIEFCFATRTPAVARVCSSTNRWRKKK